MGEGRRERRLITLDFNSQPAARRFTVFGVHVFWGLVHIVSTGDFINETRGALVRRSIRAALISFNRKQWRCSRYGTCT